MAAHSFGKFCGNDQQFGHHNLLIATILCLPTGDDDRDEFIQFCRSYKTDRDLTPDIGTFEKTYSSNEAIQWYTKPTGFPSQLVNDVCRTQDALLIFKVRYYLRDLYQQLKQLHCHTLQWVSDRIVVYRGRVFSFDEMKQLLDNVGELVSTKTFLSTTVSHEVATIFSGYVDRSTHLAEYEFSVIFKILIETKAAWSKPFGYIDNSCVEGEKELLMSIGTVFRSLRMIKRGNVCEVLLLHGHAEAMAEQKMLQKTIESCDRQKKVTASDFLTWMNIDVTSSSEFTGLRLSALPTLLQSSKLAHIATSTSSSELTESPFTIIKDSTVSYNHLTIWLDKYIGEPDHYGSLKQELIDVTSIDVGSEYIQDKIDELIVASDMSAQLMCPLVTFTTPEECLSAMERNQHKNIFLITSGSLGEYVVPIVRRTYPNVSKIYVFCANMLVHWQWANDYIDDLLMFNFHADMYPRVTFDIAQHYIKQGEYYEVMDENARALASFVIAKQLLERGNKMLSLRVPFSLEKVNELIKTAALKTPEESLLPTTENR